MLRAATGLRSVRADQTRESGRENDLFWAKLLVLLMLPCIHEYFSAVVTPR